MDGGALRRCKASFAIDLHPSYSGSALTGIREHLDAWLLRWNHELGGVMLSHTHLHVESSEARIHPYFPFFHVDVAADVHLFCPEPGHTLSGRVNKIGADYVGLLVLGVFNAAIGRLNIRSDFVYQPLGNCWASQKRPDHVIEEGSEILFTVHEVQNEGDFFSLTGKLLSRSTGAVSHVGASPLEDHRKTKKRRISEVPASNVQLEEQLQQKSTAKKHRLHQANGPIEQPPSRQPVTTGMKPQSKQPLETEVQPEAGHGCHGSTSLDADSAEGAATGTAERKKKRRRDAKVEGVQQPDQIKNYYQNYKVKLGLDRIELPENASPSMAARVNEEPVAAQFLTPGKTAAALPDLQIKSEPGSLLGKLSKKQRKKLGLSSGDTPGFATPVTIKTEPRADAAVPQHAAAQLSGPGGVGDALAGLSKKQRKKLKMSMPDPAPSAGILSDIKEGVKEEPVSLEQGPASNTTPGQASILAGNHIAVKEEGGSSGKKRQKEKALGMATVGHVKAEHGISNGESHPLQHAHLEADLPVVLGKKQKQRSKLGSHAA